MVKACDIQLIFAILLGITQVILSSKDCGYRILGRMSGSVVQSPNYPFKYTKNLTCTWEFIPPLDLYELWTYCLTFHRFDLKLDPQCNEDWLQLPDGSRYCGQGLLSSSLTAKSFGPTIWDPLCWKQDQPKDPLILRFSSGALPGNHHGFFGVIRGFVGEAPASCSTAHVNSSLEVKTSSYISEHGKGCEENFVAPCSQDEWTCFNRKCIPRDEVCNEINDCGDDSDEDGCVIDEFYQPKSCDFSESVCGIMHLDGWHRTNKPSNNAFTGPQRDHTSGEHSQTDSYYLMTHMGQNNSNRYFTSLLYPVDNDFCYSFWYHMAGDPTKKFSIATRGVIIWKAEGDLGSRWHHGQIDLSGDGTPILLIFDVSSTFSKPTIFALDDFFVAEMSCLDDEIVSLFEHGSCGWLYEDTEWAWHPPSPDEKLQGGYMMVEHKSLNKALIATIEKNVLAEIEPNPKCFRLKYRVTNKDGSGSASLLLSALGFTETTGSRLKEHRIRTIFLRKSPAVKWITLTLELPAISVIKLRITAVADPWVTLTLNLDDVSMTLGHCPPFWSQPEPEESEEENQSEVSSGSIVGIGAVAFVCILIIVVVSALMRIHFRKSKRQRDRQSSTIHTPEPGHLNREMVELTTDRLHCSREEIEGKSVALGASITGELPPTYSAALRETGRRPSLTNLVAVWSTDSHCRLPPPPYTDVSFGACLAPSDPPHYVGQSYESCNANLTMYTRSSDDLNEGPNEINTKGETCEECGQSNSVCHI